MILHAVGGLCNRLRAIFGWRALHGGQLKVVWDADEYVSRARWADVFEPLLRVEFVEGPPWDVEAWAQPEVAPVNWDHGFVTDLRPVPAIAQRIAGIGTMGDLAAIHVRRTDHLPNAGLCGVHVEGLEDFVLWAENACLLTRKTCYVATDNRETQAFLMQRLGFYGVNAISPAELVGTDAQRLTDHHRNGSLADAVVDLYVCASAMVFKGTRGSSFTDTIETMRRGKREGWQR